VPNVRRMGGYPRPTNALALQEMGDLEHIPLAVVKLGDEAMIVVTKSVNSPTGTPVFFRIGETWFPSIQVMEACAASDGGKEVRAHALHLSSSGTRIFLDPENDTFTVA
jgi:hypothetical protein